MRVGTESLYRESVRTASGALRRSGVLLQPEQRQSEDEKALVKLIIVFAQELIRCTVSSDALILAMGAAKAKVNPSEAVLKMFAKAVAGEHAQKYYPPGF